MMHSVGEGSPKLRC